MEHSPRTGLRFPPEITIDILQHLGKSDRWALASTSKDLYAIARDTVLFDSLRLGWWPNSEEYDIACEDFDPESDPNAKLKYDISKVEEFGIGKLIRDLKIAFADRGVSRSDWKRSNMEWPSHAYLVRGDRYEALIHGIDGLFSSTRHLRDLHLLGAESTALLRDVVYRLAARCPQINLLGLDWKWSCEPVGGSPLEFDGRFSNLMNLHIRLDAETGACGYGEHLGKFANALIHSSAGLNLKNIVVEIFNHEDQGVNWAAVGSRLSLQTLQYEIDKADKQPATILSSMTEICKHLEHFKFHVYCWKFPLEFDTLIPWFGNLTKCKTLLLNLQLPYAGYVKDANTGEILGTEEEQEAARVERLKRYLRQLASVMPALRHISWGDYEQELEAMVKREGFPEQQFRVGFRHLLLSDLEKPESEKGAYDFSE